METKKWFESKRMWIQIGNFVFGVIVLVDQTYGTKILDSQMAGFIIAILSMFGFVFVKSGTTLIK